MIVIFWVAFTLFMVFGLDFFTIWYRLPAYIHVIREGHTPHQFDPHIRKDIGTITNWCDVCKHRHRNWIHINQLSSDGAEGNYVSNSELLRLETADIKWRFENDPEWVAVFGGEYDPKTFQPIPQFHNGECGGPNDSCERCAWEADTAEAKAKEKESQRTAAEAKLQAAEIAGYKSILRDIWDTLNDPTEANQEFTEIRDEIGLLKKKEVRREIILSDIFKRLEYCLVTREANPKTWAQREEAWDRYKEKQRDVRRYYG